MECGGKGGIMAGMVKRFEDLIAWQRARELRRLVMAVTRQTGFREDPWLADQMRRAARSVMANIAEGFDRHTRPEFRRFLGMAKGSCAELRSDLYTALDERKISQAQFEDLSIRCEEEARIIAGLRASLREQPKRSS